MVSMYIYIFLFFIVLHISRKALLVIRQLYVYFFYISVSFVIIRRAFAKAKHVIFSRVFAKAKIGRRQANRQYY